MKISPFLSKTFTIFQKIESKIEIILIIVAVARQVIENARATGPEKPHEYDS
jgi:hypothetical protein